MDDEAALLKLLAHHGWSGFGPATEDQIEELEARFQTTLPSDYRAILRAHGGGSLYGFATPLTIFSVVEVLALFREHDLYRHIPRSLVFGGDGGGTIYGFDLREGRGQRVFFVREEDSGWDPHAYEMLVYQGTTLTDTIRRIIAGEKLN